MTSAVPSVEAQEILVRYGELALKKQNRPEFERALASNMRAAARHIAPVRIDRMRGRFSVIPERRVLEVARALQRVFGIKSVSPAWRTESTPDAIVEVGRAVLSDALSTYAPDATITFRVTTRRIDKKFPMSSKEFDRYLADRVLADLMFAGAPDIRVQLDDAELVLGVEIRERHTYVYSRRLAGPGGLPVGTTGRGLCLISGGIDSPVAAWLAMKRGLAMSFVTFHSFPFIGDESKRKVIELVRVLSQYQPSSRLYVAPFADIQTLIRDRAPEGYRTVLYRRMMQRIAAAVARRYELDVLVTGESLGQVASQTLENIECIADADPIAVMRPLIAFDKEETITVARRIETFDISNRQEPDCCTVFMPARPIIRGKPSVCRSIESDWDLEAMVRASVDAIEIHDVDPAA